MNWRMYWWAAATACGCIFGIIVVSTVAMQGDWWMLVRLRSYALFVLTSQGIVLGAVGGYIMGWLSPFLPDWHARFHVAAIVGAVVGGAAPGPEYVHWNPWYGVPGIVAALISTTVVKLLAERRPPAPPDHAVSPGV